MSQHVRVIGAAVAVSALVSASALAAGPAVAGPAQGSVTAFLRAPNLAGLDRLAAAHGLTHAQRVAALAHLVPSNAVHQAVTNALATDGLAVSGQTAWSVTAHGSLSDIAAAFGQLPTAVLHPTAAEFRAETGALPVVPSALAPYVTGVFPTTGGPAAFQHSAATVLDGTDFRNAYTSPGTTPPGSGATDDGNSTVATLQLANYTNSDLTTYASKQTPALPNIVGTSKYHEVTVDGGPSESDDASGADLEVDLDQESILSTAPSATQRPYFAPNTDAGFNDVFANAFDDVVQNSHDNDGGDPNITALSTSWGGCESGYGASEIATTETVIEALVAAGVTVFASSGDDGIYDCSDSTMTGLDNSQADVDFPASSPEVVGVGGTNLQFTGSKSAPNTGTNWNETAWTCSSTVTCESSVPTTLPPLPSGTGGSGGGESGSAYSKGTSDSFAGFAAPAYQTDTIHSALFKDQKHRMVPDIAADGDPATGFDVYTSDPQYLLDEDADGFVQVGGTSLSSPTSAALFTNTLAAAGKHTGIGDIHDALYSAGHMDPAAFRDVTVGTNGATANKGTDPSVSAHVGYDTVTGLGGVLWPALTPYLLNTAAPTAHASIGLASLHSKTKSTRITAFWRSTAGSDKSLPVTAAISVTKVGGTKALYAKPTVPVSGSYSFTGSPGATYELSVTTTDLSGTTSPAASARVTVPIDDRQFHFHGSWHRSTGASAIAGSYAWTQTAGASASLEAAGSKYRLAVVTGPKYGRLGVYQDATLLKTVNLYSPRAGERLVTVLGGPNSVSALRDLRFVCLGTKSRHSKGDRVAVDGLYAS